MLYIHMHESRHLGFYKHGNLPHLDIPGAVQFITIVMADAAPPFQQPRCAAPDSGDGYEMVLAMDTLLDQSSGTCLLQEKRLALCVTESISRTARDGQHKPIAWVIMPNHIHLVSLMPSGSGIGKLVNRLKSGSASSINKQLQRSGKFWQRGYFDRKMRDMNQFWRTIDYIHMNPVSAGLVADPKHWEMSSIHGYSRKAALEVLGI